MTALSPTLRSPLIAGRYLVRSKLGSGGTGTVYLAHDQVAHREVALKVIRPERLDEDRHDALRKEFQELFETIFRDTYDICFLYISNCLASRDSLEQLRLWLRSYISLIRCMGFTNRYTFMY